MNICIDLFYIANDYTGNSFVYQILPHEHEVPFCVSQVLSNDSGLLLLSHKKLFKIYIKYEHWRPTCT